MGDKRYKLARGLGDFVPVSINFSALEKDSDEEEREFEPSDMGKEEREMVDSLIYEGEVVNILCNLEPREKLIFVFQLLRDSGFQIDHNSFAKVVQLSRRQYMRILDDVRLKTYLYIQGFRKQNRLLQGHKEA
jgi:hypothetical protein